MTEELKALEAALEKAAATGNVAAAAAITADMQRLMQRSNPRLGMPDPVPLGQEGMPSAIRQTAAAAPRAEQALAGIGSAGKIGYNAIADLMPKPPMMDMSGPRRAPGGPAPAASGDLQNQQALASATPYSVGGNIAGNVGMFAALPSTLGAGITRAGTGKVPSWLAGRFGVAGDTAATSSVLNAATTPGDAGERVNAGLLGGATALGVPLAYAVGAGGRRMVTKAGKRVAVGEGISEELGQEAADRLANVLALKQPPSRVGAGIGAEVGEDGAARLGAAVREPDAAGLLGIRHSAANRSREPVLEALESGSRVSRGDLWRPFDKENASARWAALRNLAGTPEELGILKASRESTTGAMRRDALDNAQVSAQFTRGDSVSQPTLQPITQRIAEWRSGGLRPNKDVQLLGNYLESELKQGVTPEQLYEVRKVLTDGIKAGRTDELSNAIKAARVQRIEAVGMIDDALETLSGGGWKEYLKTYSGKSLPITSKQALQDMVKALERGQPLGETPTAMTASWKTLGNLRDRFGHKEIGGRMFDRLEPADRDTLNTLVDSLKRQSDSMTTKATLGSPTAGLLANTGRAQRITQGLLGASAGGPMAGLLTASAFDSLGRKAEAELARLLQDPQALVQALEAAKRAQTLSKVSSKAGAAAGGAAQ